MPKMKLWGRTVRLPRSRPLRVVMGFAFIAMGLVGFMPVVGFWMIPVGLAILSVDSPLARRFRRRAEVWVLRRYNRWRGRDGGST
ncbi:PGPGW domain-containing protein [Pleomorphomonas sp. PLEO]|uniref:PGPGW domain-containing protein n=1 Tax=Pleomorphomonas sp. PLEO TaxID=3239306 RepID=UPI00351ED702